LWKNISSDPQVYSKDDLIRTVYPSPPQDNYLVIEIKPVTDAEFQNVTWDFKKLANYSTRRASAFPFTANVTELMKNKTK